MESIKKLGIVVNVKSLCDLFEALSERKKSLGVFKRLVKLKVYYKGLEEYEYMIFEP